MDILATDWEVEGGETLLQQVETATPGEVIPWEVNKAVNQEKWYTLEECWEQAGKQFPFEVEEKNGFHKNYPETCKILNKKEGRFKHKAHPKWPNSPWWSPAASISTSWRLASKGLGTQIEENHRAIQKYLNPDTCTCDLTLLLQAGCKCGGN